MPHFPKPFFRKPRKLWYVQIDGKQVNLGPDKDEAFRQYHQLMARPKERRAVHSGSLASIIDAFLEWVQRHRSPETYEWYRYRLQRLAKRYPALRAVQLLPYHITEWVDSYELGQTSKRNYIRSIKRCMKWSKQQGYLQSAR